MGQEVFSELAAVLYTCREVCRRGVMPVCTTGTLVLSHHLDNIVGLLCQVLHIVL